jgi:hypothetical protein
VLASDGCEEGNLFSDREGQPDGGHLLGAPFD